MKDNILNCPDILGKLLSIDFVPQLFTCKFSSQPQSTSNAMQIADTWDLIKKTEGSFTTGGEKSQIISCIATEAGYV